MPDKSDPRIVVIGASAGGVRALRKVMSSLPAGLDAAVFIVLHLWPDTESLLPQILSRTAALPVSHAGNGAAFRTGNIYIAPPDRHVVLHDGMMRVLRGPKENRHRPSIDVLFRSAAMNHGERVVGVLLTGADDDGAAGMRLIQERGGVTIVQDPEDSAHPEMPRSALRLIEPDFRVPLDEVGPTVRAVVEGVVHAPGRKIVPQSGDIPLGQVEGKPVDTDLLGSPSAFSCPDCDGTLWELREGELLRYRCRVGHAYSVESMVDAQSESVERALWAAVRVLEESAAISRRIAEKTATLRQDLQAKADQREAHAQVIRELLLSTKPE